MADISIINLTVDQVVDVLETRLIDEVIAVDELDTKARLVRAGKLQEDPTKQTGIQILVHPNYPGEPDKWPHKVAMGEEFGLSFPVGEIGGGLYFWRRYTAEIVFMDKLLAVVPFEVVDSRIMPKGR